MSRLSRFGFTALLAGLVVTTSLSAQGRRGGGFGFGGQGGLLRIAGNDAVQKEIGVTDDQKAKLKTIGEEFAKDQEEARASGPGAGGFQDLSQEERAKLMEQMMATAKKLNDKYVPKLKETLKPEQFERLQQISYQAAGPAAYANADVVKALDLTKEQQEKIATINKDFQEKMRALFAGGGAGGPEVFAKLGEEQSADLAKVLTTEQSEKFAKLKGKAFDVSVLRGGGPGGPGGRPGGAKGRPGGDKKKVD
jgi:Spy/CpxP family protein refolding chaperone